jgi:hypothetical protein
LIRGKNRHTYDWKKLMLSDPSKELLLKPDDKIIVRHR